VLDAIAGLWCVNAGHRNPRISAAMKAQIDVLDYASNFQIGHPARFVLAERLAQWRRGHGPRVLHQLGSSRSTPR
jgi:beta-alanine--pyruvate transaminase